MMGRLGILQSAVDSFCQAFNVTAALTVATAEDSQWTPEQRLRVCPHGYPSELAGVYFYWEDSRNGKATLRYLGMTDFEHGGFYDRHRNAGWFRISRNRPYVEGLPRIGNYFRLIEVRWIDIVPFPRSHDVLICSLERFLLRTLRTSYNKSGVPSDVWAKPEIIVSTY